ncbi:M48 family metallopeptidase [Alphaproteobacteria bacterium KMM 3653]|uniref:M48 family metallopeptidase n=1 Tax=Harenicola maris TaxID=2841044 RepID=A0AAP2G4M4_9RHOB|nr:M48 family metallopeptidase [Harenicola maris]
MSFLRPVSHLSLAGAPPVEVTLRRSARARRLSLRISRIDGAVTLTLPKRVPLREAQRFIDEKAEWIRANLAQQPVQVLVGPGAMLPVEGVMRRIEAGGKRVQMQGETLRVPEGSAAQMAARLAGFCKARARDRLAEACDHYAAALGRPYGRLTLRDTRSRWGSCSSAGNLMFSWRLILAPPQVLDYVAAHEVAHLAQMNHSAAFWAEVRALMPDYEAPRRWLRDEGNVLHSYRFEGAD